MRLSLYTNEIAINRANTLAIQFGAFIQIVRNSLDLIAVVLLLNCICANATILIIIKEKYNFPNLIQLLCALKTNKYPLD